MCVYMIGAGWGLQKYKRKLLHLLYSNRLLFDLVIISLSLEGEDRVKQNQPDLSSGNYAAYRYPITNSYGPLDFNLTMTQVHCVTAQAFAAINLQHRYCRHFTGLEMLKLMAFLKF